MSELYIKVKRDGFILPYSDILAANPGCDVVSEEVAFPERFVPEFAKKPVRRKRVDLTTGDVPAEPETTPPELAADAARGLPR